MSKFGLPCAFLVKAIHINFQVENICNLRKKMFITFIAVLKSQ